MDKDEMYPRHWQAQVDFNDPSITEESLAEALKSLRQTPLEVEEVEEHDEEETEEVLDVDDDPDITRIMQEIDEMEGGLAEDLDIDID